MQQPLPEVECVEDDKDNFEVTESEKKGFVFSLDNVFSDESSVGSHQETTETKADFKLEPQEICVKKEIESKPEVNEGACLSGDELKGFNSVVLGPDYGKLDIVIKTLEEKQNLDQRKFCEKLENSNVTKIYFTNDEELNHKCNDCLIYFEDSFSLKIHIETLHAEEKDENQGLLDCPICGKLNLTDNQISIHQQIHTSGKHLECEFCLKGFNQRDTLDKHIQEQHLNDSKEKYICRYFNCNFGHFGNS